MSKYIFNSINGIWNSYGKPPDYGSGITLSIIEDETKFLGNNPKTGSLKYILNLNGDERQIGEFADFTEVSELVVMMPMLQKDPGHQQDPTVSDIVSNDKNIDCDDCVDDPFNYRKTVVQNNKTLEEKLFFNQIENAKLFKIKEETINKILGVVNYRDTAKKYSIFDFKKLLEDRLSLLNLNNNIVKLMLAMVNYYFPPHLNWLFDTTIDPIAMYVAEFKTILYKNDLSNIWQGNMPNQALEPEEEEIEIEHFLKDEEMFDGYDINDQENLKISVFKCKKRASSNYYKSLQFSTTEGQEKEKWYNYNWPYDNFSLVELAQIQMGEVRDYKNDGTLEQGVLKEERTKSVTQGNTVITLPVK